MLGDLRKKLEPIGKLDILNAVGEQAMSYFGQVPPESLSDTELAARAQALRQIGDVRVQQGKLAEASPAFREALALDEELVRRHPEDQQAIFNVAQSAFYIGYDLFLRSNYDDALTWFGRYDHHADQLLALAPENLVWRREKNYALDNLATAQLRRGEYVECARLAAAAADVALKILAAEPKDSGTLVGLESNYSKAAACAGHSGNLDEQLQLLMKADSVSSQRALDSPGDFRALDSAATFKVQLLSALLDAGQLDDAKLKSEEALRLWTRLIERDPDNASARLWWTTAMRLKAELAVLEDRDAEALSLLDLALPHLDSGRAANEEQVYRAYVLRFHGLRLELSSGLGRSAEGVDSARFIAAALSAPGTAPPQVDEREQLACIVLRDLQPVLALPSQGVCADILTATPRDPSRLGIVVQAMLEVLGGATLSDSPSAQALDRLNYHGAEWHLFKRRHSVSDDTLITTRRVR